MKLNRVWLVTALIVFGSVFYELRLKPQSRPLYDSALTLYKQGKFSDSLKQLQRAYEIEPNSTAIVILMGWNQLKLGRMAEAESSFSRATVLDPSASEAKLGLDYVAVQSGRAGSAVENIQTLLNQDPNNPDFKLAAAAVFRQTGRNQEAATLFRSLLRDSRLGQLSRKNLEEMYGIEKLGEEIPAGFAAVQRPAELVMNFRTAGSNLQRREGNAWNNFYVKGVNLGPGTPGHFASEAPTLMQDYLQWLDEISRLGANTIRVYTALPPAFYRALQRHNESSAARLYLLQEIHLSSGDPQAQFSPEAETAAREAVAQVIDLIHGQGDLSPRYGAASGLFAKDVSGWVMGFVIGLDLSPRSVQAINRAHPDKVAYSGQYVSVEKGNATEVWLASLLDYAASYEVTKYNQQRPLAMVNLPALDPLSHSTEASLAEEFAFRRKLGEKIVLPDNTELVEDDDIVSVDENHWEASDKLKAGLFASYSVFPFYPDFMYREPEYLAARDREGPNPFFGYLKALKQHYRNLPLVASEYGASTSLGISRFHPFGWNHGGLTEKEQGTALARMTRDISEAGWAGGLIFEWQDEWYRANWLTGPLAIPEQRRSLWSNRLDPDQNFGLWTYDPSSEAQLFSSHSGWKSITPEYSKDKGPASTLRDGWDQERTLRSLSVTSDEAFVYLRLEVGKIRQDSRKLPDLQQAQYYIGISTNPGQLGSRTLPGLAPQVRAETGANLLLYLGTGGIVRLLVSAGYNPRQFQAISGLGANVRLAYRVPFEPHLEEWTGFEEILTETNRRRFSRDGHTTPPQRYSLSELRYRPAGQADDTLATWTCDFAENAFIFRLPWAMLFVTDPSSHLVLSSIQGGPKFVPTETAGLELMAAAFRTGDPIAFNTFPLYGLAVQDALPALDPQGVFQGLKVYRWPKWNTVRVRGRWKASHDQIEKALREVKGIAP